MVKLRFHSSVATLQAHKSERVLKPNCYKYKKKYKRNDFGVISDHAHGRHHPTY